MSLTVLGLSTSLLAAANSWQWVSPSPTANRIASFAYGAGIFVGTGDAGEIITSPDGATWTTRESGIKDWISHVVYDGTRFWAISGATLLRSSDGSGWTTQNAPANLYDIASGNNLLVAIAAPAGTGQSSRLLTSTDGTNWTSYDSGGQLTRVLFANGVFVAVDTTGHALSSVDGITWVSTPLSGITTTPFFAAGNGRFLISYSDKTYVSTNGTTWREVTSHPTETGTTQALTVPHLEGSVAGSTMGFAGGYFYIQQSRYASDSYRFYRSSDGETWEKVAVYYGADLSTLASGGGALVGSELTQNYAGINASAFVIHSSNDGISWTTRTTLPVTSGSSLVYGLGRFFLGGLVSNDATTWTSSPFEPTHAAGDLVFRVTSLFAGSDRPTTVIDSRAVTSVAVSADGLTSLPVDVKIATPRAVAFGAGRYVFVGDGGNVASSADGLTWSAGSSGTTNNLQAVLFAFSRFVAVGSGGTLITSPDGLTWTVQNTATTIDFLSVAAGPDRIVVGTNGTGVTSPTLTLPGSLPVHIAASRRSNALVWFDGEFTSVEFQPSVNYTVTTSVARSLDGNTWSEVGLRFPPALSGRAMMATGNGIALMLLPGGIGWIPQNIFPVLFQKRNSSASAPVITQTPVSTTVHRGETASFSVGAFGSGTLTYQWNRNGAPIPGATGLVYSLDLPKDSDAGDYSVTVTNSLGSVTSPNAKLTIEAPVPLTITRQPVGGTLYEFQVFALTVEVTGSGPYSYQWRKNGTVVATSAKYEIYAASYSMDNYAGTYDVVVTAPYSSVTSEKVVVNRSGPNVTVTRSGNLTVGGTLIATASVTGKSPFTYSWNLPGGQHLAGADGPTLILPNLTTTDTAPYSLTVTDADGLPTQVFFTVSVSGAGTTPITSEVTAAAGQKLTLRAPVSISLVSETTFQWRFKNEAIPGATARSFTTPAMSDTAVGDYSVVVTNSSGVTTYTTTVKLGSVPTVPAFVAQTTSRTIAAGNSTTFSVSAGNSSVTTYQWQVSTNSGSTWTNLAEGSPYSGTTTNILGISGATAAMNGYQYRCVAGNSTGSATSTAATLSINNDPLLVHPVAVARDSSGNLFVADASANVIRMITPAAVTSVFAGTAGSAGSQDGIGSAARFNQPGGLAFDPTGNLYVADTGNATIRRITSTGTVTTLAGDSTARGNVDATGNAARFNHPVGVATDATGAIYVSDSFAHTVRKITATGIVTTLAGTNTSPGSADGSGPTARFSGPEGVSVDTSGNVYIADTGNSTIRKITSAGAVTTISGLPGVAGSNDGVGNNALFSQPTNLAVDANGTVYVADTGNALIRRIASNGNVTSLAGVPGIAGFSDGIGLDALFDQPRGIALDGLGSAFVVDTGNAALRKISANGTVTSLALVAAPTPTPATNPTPAPPSSTTAPTSSPSTNSGGGGGGNTEAWLGLLIFALSVIRFQVTRNQVTQP